jgi:hypothetical protein
MGREMTVHTSGEFPSPVSTHFDMMMRVAGEGEESRAGTMLMKEGQFPVALQPIRQRSHEVIQPARWRCGARWQAFWKRSTYAIAKRRTWWSRVLG